MFRINRIKVEILTTDQPNVNFKFGFDFSLNPGLNIIAGENSRGKTTINSCIYYALGMEELLGAQNEKALDKALKDNFTIKEGVQESITYNVLFSKVLLEIQNDVGDIVTIVRYIKVPNNSERDVKLAYIYAGKMDLHSTSFEEIYFIRGRNNNSDDNGFYNWLANFMNLELPTVSNTSKAVSHSPLYLQVIFSSFFIEQTKGWSDFFATMPFFGIPYAKEKIVEFLLNLNELGISTRKDELTMDKKNLSEEWKKLIKTLEFIISEYNGNLINVPEELTVEQSALDLINTQFRTEMNENKLLDEIIANAEIELVQLKERPIAKISESKTEIVQKYNSEKKAYFEFREYVNQFLQKLKIEKIQLNDLESQRVRLEKEVANHNALLKVFRENVINSKGGNYCPTCTQVVDLDLISSANITIPKLSLEENIAFLNNQKLLITTSIKSLRNATTEKESLEKYLLNNLRNQEDLIKSLSRDLIADDRDFSESNVLKRVQLEKWIEDLKYVKFRIEEIIEELRGLSVKYHNNLIDLNNLSSAEVEDEEKLKLFETTYKASLGSFGYESNDLWQISITRSQPFKYFPVYKRNQNDLPQSIRINSSASDFVRNIWAYSLALLAHGENHPGIVIFDEPGQHRTKLSSLKALFNESANYSQKQTIIFTSIDKQLNEDEKIDLDVLTEDLDSSSFNLIKLDGENKAIKKLF